MSRSRDKKPARPGLGVGGLAGTLPHGAGEMVRSLTTTPASGPESPPAAPGAAPSATAGPHQPSPGGAPVTPAGADIDLFAPTDRPWEPMGAGLDGPSTPPADPDILLLAPMLPALEMLAARPGSSVAMRNTVRRLRSMVPPDFDFSQVLSGPGGQG